MNPLYLQADDFERLYWVPECARRLEQHVEYLYCEPCQSELSFEHPHDLDVRGESILWADLPHAVSPAAGDPLVGAR